MKKKNDSTMHAVQSVIRRSNGWPVSLGPTALASCVWFCFRYWPFVRFYHSYHPVTIHIHSRTEKRKTEQRFQKNREKKRGWTEVMTVLSLSLDLLSLPTPSHPIRFHPIPSYHIPSYPISSHPILPYSIPSYPILSHPLPFLTGNNYINDRNQLQESWHSILQFVPVCILSRP